ncbi:hypothetical protein [Roseovarius sp. 2305UL8-3]|uniref:hypothetical protein n=1 Tax=Roseovarius conchicola TaxID=3121636 RepID=UPI0035274578
MDLRYLIVIATLTLVPLQAQSDQQPVFKSYEEMRSTLDSLMMAREMEQVMRRFGASDEMTDEQLRSLEVKVRTIFPGDFRHVDLLKRDDMGNGWARELYAYWSGLSYIYVAILMHDRGSEIVSINFKFNTDFDDIVQNF